MVQTFAPNVIFFVTPFLSKSHTRHRNGTVEQTDMAYALQGCKKGFKNLGF